MIWLWWLPEISETRMLLRLIQLTGWLIAHLPEPAVQALAWVLGRVLYHGYPPRRRIMLHNLRCSFPERSPHWVHRIAKENCVRIVETALLLLASPSFSDERMRQMGSLSPELVQAFARLRREPRPLVLGSAHLAYWEGMTWLPLLLGEDGKIEFLTIYRPLRDPGLDGWLRGTRERFGVRMMSRRGGLHVMLHVLQRQGCVTLLFDQSAGSHGFLTKFLGRECSTTPLPGLLVEKSGAEVALIYPRRRAFWRFAIEFQPIPSEPTAQAVTLALDRALEEKLRNDESLCASWLWMHQRWRILDRPAERRKLEAKRGSLIQ